MQGMGRERIRSLDAIDFSTLSFEDLRWRYGVFQGTSTGSGREKKYGAWIGVETALGEIEEKVWYRAAEKLIRQKGERELLEHLERWEAEHDHTKGSPGSSRKRALQLHISRIFDDPLWVDFVPFDRRYRPEILKTAHLVTVVSECCQRPGVVTQEQVDAARAGTIACPCCGRWSPFVLADDAISAPEHRAGQTAEGSYGAALLERDGEQLDAAETACIRRDAPAEQSQAQGQGQEQRQGQALDLSMR